MTAVRRAAFFAFALSLASAAFGDSDGKRQILRPHGDSSRKFDIIEDGERVGSIRIDRDGDKAKIRDDDGNVTGTLRRDDDDRHEYQIYHGEGPGAEPAGRIERQDEHHKRYDIEDSSGKKIGEIRPRHGEKHQGEYVVEYE